MNKENRLPQPTTIEQKYGALLGIMTGIIANEDIFHTSKAVDHLIYTYENNIANETEQFVLDQAKEYKEGSKIFPIGEQSNAPGWALQNQLLEEIIPQEVCTKIFDLSLTHGELDIIVDALFFYQSAMQLELTGEQEKRLQGIYDKLGIKTETH